MGTRKWNGMPASSAQMKTKQLLANIAGELTKRLRSCNESYTPERKEEGMALDENGTSSVDPSIFEMRTRKMRPATQISEGGFTTPVALHREKDEF